MTVDMFSRWRALLGLSFFLAGTAIAVASLAPMELAMPAIPVQILMVMVLEIQGSL